jgi:hypothetical protein
MTEQRIIRYRGYTMVFTEWGGMWRAVVELPSGGTKSTGYCLSYGAAVLAAERIVDKNEQEPPLTFGSGK